MTDKATRLYPLPPREIPADKIYDDLVLPPAEWGQSSRPYVVINMVSSVDGKAAIGGKAARLGSEIDRQTMRNLRSRADAVMIGANTLRTEKLSLGLDDSREPQPLAVVVTASGELPLDTNLIVGDRQEVLVITPRGVVVRLPQGQARTNTLSVPRRGSAEIDLGKALQILKAERGVDLLLVEGGPMVNRSLVSRNLADELFLTLAPKLIGGPASGILPEQPAMAAIEAHLLCAYLAQSELFLRYALQPSHH